MLPLVYKHCPQPHAAAITAVAYDNTANSLLLADEWGTIALYPNGATEPSFIEETGIKIDGAAAVSDGGALFAVGDDNGSIKVWRTRDGALVFEEHKEGEKGEARAMRALSFTPQGDTLATLALDGVIRIYDLTRGVRTANYKTFISKSISFDASGQLLLTVNSLGQPVILDLQRQEELSVDPIPGGCIDAKFTADSRGIVVLRDNGLTKVSLPDGHITASFSAEGASGLHALLLNPEGTEFAAITGRSAHRFSIEDLSPVGSDNHGVEDATGIAVWTPEGIRLGRHAGCLSDENPTTTLPQIICTTGFGDRRVAVHENYIAVWDKNRQKRPFKITTNAIEARIDRDGRLLLILPEEGGVQVLDARTGRVHFDAGEDTADTPKMEVGGPVVAIALPAGGLRWYELKQNKVFSLDWVEEFSVSGSGTWLTVTTPQGGVKVLDPATGESAIPDPFVDPEERTLLTAFVNRSPQLLTFTESGHLYHYDLAPSVTDDVAAKPTHILTIHVPVDALWGITGGKYAALRLQDEETQTASIITIDISTKEVIAETNGLLPYVTVDPETGNPIEPAIGNAIAEYNPDGSEKTIYRALPNRQWICFSADGSENTSTSR
jgi:WD40 repeat protein